MNSKTLFILIASMFLVFNTLSSQNQNNNILLSPGLKDSFNLVYGFDPILYNGKIYKYFPKSNIIGNQFFIDENFLPGEITIRDKKYSNLKLNYDIYNQDLILKFESAEGFINSLIVSKAWLQEFSISGFKFKICKLNDFPERIYQVIGDDSVQIYYYHKKNLELNNVSGLSRYTFKHERTRYLYKNRILYQYSTNKSFVKLFNTRNQPDIRQFMRKNKIKVKKSSDAQINQLISFCNDL
jgi:hypothetical protein